MSQVFRYGVIGTGMMGIEHIQNINHIEGAVVAAYADPHSDSRAAADTVTDDAVGFPDHRQLLDSGLCDAVVIASPNHTHARILEDALSSDLHILVEKPLCTTVEDSRRMVELAAGREAVTWVGLEYRYMPPIARLMTEVAEGAVGDIKMVAIREHRFPFLVKVDDWNRFNHNTGGTLVEKCCHYFDLMNAIIGESPLRVFASGAQDVNHLEEEYDGAVPDILDNAYVVLDYPGGVRAMLDLCMFAEATHNQEEVVVVGNEGKVEAMVPEMVVRIGKRGRHFIGDVETHHVEDPAITYLGHHHGSSQLEHLDFIEACRSGTTPKVGLEDGLISVAIGVAAHRSIQDGRPVELAEVLA